MDSVAIDDASCAPRMKTNVERAIPYESVKSRETGEKRYLDLSKYFIDERLAYILSRFLLE